MATDLSFEEIEGCKHEIRPSSATPAAAEAAASDTFDTRSLVRSIVERGGYLKASNASMVAAMHAAGVEINADGDVVRLWSGVVCGRLDPKPFASDVEILPMIPHTRQHDPLEFGV